MKNIFVIATFTVLLAGCSLAPDFMKPEIKTTEVFKEDPGQWKEGVPSAHLPRGEWWKVFGDETLDLVMSEAMTGNFDLQAMAARVVQARETARITSSAFFPSLDGDGGATRQKPNAVSRGMAGGSDLAIEDSVRLNAGLSYEIDLFGRVLNSSRAAKSDAAATAEDYKSIELALQAEVAQTYFTLRGLDAEIALLTQTVDLREQSLDVLKKRLAAGSITELDTAQNTVELEVTRTELHEVIQRRKEHEHALAFLLGLAPAQFQLMIKPLTVDVPRIPAGLPSALLERRPDITAAEYKLVAANARIGVAKTAFFPNIALTANGGVEAATLGDLFQWSSRSWSIGPMITLPIFGGGKAIANYHRSQAYYDEAVALYRQAVLAAFRDVEDALSRLKTLDAQRRSQDIAKASADKASSIAELRYDNGDIGYLEAMTAKRSALDAGRYGLQIRTAQLVGTVGLIRSLGGGWDISTVKTSSPAEKTPIVP